ncbi:hypothetical protein ACJIZ3_005282 [Penstemon smallii]|uniref:SHSP domain-containing protein n=1 Tax=Penstemon smallii TaxID=265156 RepID=A0ABD3S4J9_9LAMI
MATSGDRRLDKKSSSLMFVAITPPHEWKEDDNSYYLCLTIPGFESENITINVDKYGHLVVRGHMQVSEHKFINFEETYELPQNSNIEDAGGQFQDEQIYCVIIPKQKEKTIRHKISTPKEEKTTSPPKKKQPVEKKPILTEDKVDSFHRYEDSEKPQESHPSKPHLQIITTENKKKKITFSVALVLILIVIAVPLIIKFHH